jgi:hypothetical protein
MRITSQSSNCLLGTTLLKYPTPAADRDQPVSRIYPNNLGFKLFYEYSVITNGMDYTTTLAQRGDRRVIRSIADLPISRQVSTGSIIFLFLKLF